jgi:hypothetical protein
MIVDTPTRVLLETLKVNTHADMRGELHKLAVPTLIVHGDQDASAPIDLTGRTTAALIAGATLMIYRRRTRPVCQRPRRAERRHPRLHPRPSPARPAAACPEPGMTRLLSRLDAADCHGTRCGYVPGTFTGAGTTERTVT